MNRWKFAVLLLLLNISSNAFCQQARNNADSIDNKLFVALSPAGLIDIFDYPSLRISAEAKIYRNLSFSVEQVLYPINSFKMHKANVSGYAVKPAIKVYLNKKGIIGGKYIALEYQYKQQAYDLSDSIKFYGGAPFPKDYQMTRYINCINVKYGELTQLHKRWIIEWFAGVGIRSTNSMSSLSEQEYNRIIKDEEHKNSLGPGGFVREIGLRSYPNITLGFKIGYRIL
ncbi:DUF3575 domain-containing protein [Pseudoflavitalea sp. G-6-1-2]|uniref:DUF3575 domain-containing protein n=1 Tax=Pseudoflavitalea sp. G-6-1-2 TaxID=2728841 RepID=UPI00146E1CE9|nr:DUF3575 domain-containing protein [Pseudoflavitalea sp. G-6-1-2]NML22807.1 DUF3575 domain-containing protein [Pseudoflavitalea sp. G-6-1-2]